ncbi:MAG TPA: hypothetical protein VJW73_08915 [Gemmatimonadaceae bacterium]|nr:hypothetical protein [Gemmatimonadaceae bacterium]
MNAPLMALLRLIHILAGIFWLGATLTLAGFLLPAIRGSRIGTGTLWRSVMQRQRLQLWINISMTLAILAGFALYAIDSAATNGAFARSTAGKTFGLGALFAIAAAGVMGAMSQPSSRKLAALADRIDENPGAAIPTDLATAASALQDRISRGLTIASVLLLLSATMMAIARYL